MKMNVVYRSSIGYFKYLAVSLVSLFENNKEHDITVWVLCLDVNEENEKIRLEICHMYDRTINMVKVPEEILNPLKNKGVVYSRYGGLIIYTAVAIPDLPIEEDRVLFLGTDIIVNKDITDLFTLDISDYSLISVPEFIDNVSNPYSEWDINESENHLRQFPFEKPTYMSDFSLINLKKLRNEGITTKILVDWYCSLEKPPTNPVCDAGLFAYFFRDSHVKISPLKYNMSIKHYTMYSWFGYQFDNIEDFEECVSIHYALHAYPFESIFNIVKPWDYDFAQEKKPYEAIASWFRYTQGNQKFSQMLLEVPNMLKHNLFMNDIWWKYAKISPNYEQLREAESKNREGLRFSIPLIEKVANLEAKDNALKANAVLAGTKNILDFSGENADLAIVESDFYKKTYQNGLLIVENMTGNQRNEKKLLIPLIFPFKINSQYNLKMKLLVSSSAKQIRLYARENKNYGNQQLLLSITSSPLETIARYQIIDVTFGIKVEKCDYIYFLLSDIVGDNSFLALDNIRINEFCN